MTPAELVSRRRALGLSQTDLAARLGRTGPKSRDAVSLWERGKAPIPEWLRYALDGIEAEHRAGE